MATVALSGSVCTVGGGFLRRACSQPATGRCVYCGEPFCDDHGEFGTDYLEVCERKTCRLKLQDVADHKAYLDTVRPANAVSVCAHPECQERMQHICQRCSLLFCDDHLKVREVVEHRFQPPRKVPLLLCAHCTERRSLWD